MPWLETAPVEQRERLIQAHQEAIAELCARLRHQSEPGMTGSHARIISRSAAALLCLWRRRLQRLAGP